MAAEAERLARLLRDLLRDSLTFRARSTSVACATAPSGTTHSGQSQPQLSPASTAEALIAASAGGMAVSTGSACTSAAVEPSLRAPGAGPRRDDCWHGASLRIGLGRFTTEEEIEAAAEEIVAAVTRLRGTRTRAAE